METTFAGQPPRSCRAALTVAFAFALVAAALLGCGETTVSIVDRAEPSAGMTGAGGSASAGRGSTGVGGLVHHYPFDGTGTTVTDVVGGADGILVNTTLSDGTAVLAGGTSDQYVELPAGLISAWPNVTVEVWTTWDGTQGLWQRLLDFGNSDAGAGMQGIGETYVFLTPRDGNGLLKAAFSLAGPGAENLVRGDAGLSAGTLEHLAIVMDGTASLFSLYSNGTLVGSNGPLNGAFRDLDDQNSWLGRSQSEVDVEYAGQIHDLRIFSTARTAEQIAASFAAGPDLLPAE